MPNKPIDPPVVVEVKVIRPVVSAILSINGTKFSVDADSADNLIVELNDAFDLGYC